MLRAIIHTLLGAVLIGTLVIQDFSIISIAGATIFVLMHMVGIYYGKYSEVPLGDMISDAIGSDRNEYDRLVHLAFGFLASPAFYEIGPSAGITSEGWLAAFPVIMVLAVSALFEIFEWLNLVIRGDSDNEGPELQGDIWDGQKDMALAFAGSVVASAILSLLS